MRPMSIDSKITEQAFNDIREALRAHADLPARGGKRKAVLRSPEFERVRALPSRDTADYGEALIDTLTPVYAKRPFNDRGQPNRLTEAQAVCLYELAAFDGLIGQVTMGGGKTLLSILGCHGEPCSLVVLPAKLVKKTVGDAKAGLIGELATYGKDWRIPGNITFISYEKLDRPQYATYLEDLKPTRIICDEGQKLKRKGRIAHRRIKRYLKKSRASFAIFSGTLMGETLASWCELADWALHLRSPAPRTYGVQTEWSAALRRDPVIEPGALEDFGHDHNGDFREGYRVRVSQSPGFYISKGADVDAALEIERFSTTIPPLLAACVKHLDETWELPTGETIADPLAWHRAMRQLELGCYYRWRKQPEAEWRERRLMWVRAVREIVKYSRRLDSEAMIVAEIERGSLREAKDILNAWREIKETFTPESECIWIDKTPVREIAARARDGAPALVWVYHSEIGKAFTEEGVDYFGAGGLNAQGVFIENAKADRPIACSIGSNGEGRNLQYLWWRSILAEFPREPLTLEQTIARTHRRGQPRDEVELEVNTSTDASKRAWLRVLERSADVQKNSGQPQRLLLGTHVNPISEAETRALT